MSTPRNGFSKHQRAEKVCGQRGPNWILIAGGALLSTLSIRFGYKLKQSPLFKPPHQSNASPGFKANGTSERQRCCCLHSSTTSSCAKNNGYSCFRSVPDALAVNSDGRYLTTRGVDRHVHKVQFVSAFMIMCLQAFTGHKNTVFSLCFRHRTAELYSGSFDRSVKACTYGWER